MDKISAIFSQIKKVSVKIEILVLIGNAIGQLLGTFSANWEKMVPETVPSFVQRKKSLICTKFNDIVDGVQNGCRLRTKALNRTITDDDRKLDDIQDSFNLFSPL